jgi:hypothetical protein
MRARALLAATVSLAFGSCGGDEERPAARVTPERTATPTPSETPTPPPKPTRARSVQDCVDIWNASVEAGEGFQVTHTDYVADNVEAGRTKVRVAHRQAQCVVVLPIGGRRVAIMTKVPDRDYYDLPRRQRLPTGTAVEYNAIGRDDGSIELR